MKKETVKKLKILSGGILLITLVVALVYMSVGIIYLTSDPTTSFPWYYACFITLVYFVIPIFLEVVLWIYFFVKYKKVS